MFTYDAIMKELARIESLLAIYLDSYDFTGELINRLDALIERYEKEHKIDAFSHDERYNKAVKKLEDLWKDYHNYEYRIADCKGAIDGLKQLATVYEVADEFSPIE